MKGEKLLDRNAGILREAERHPETQGRNARAPDPPMKSDADKDILEKKKHTQVSGNELSPGRRRARV